MHNTGHLLDELLETIARLRTEKERSRKLQATREITDHYGPGANVHDMGEFGGAPYLVVPYRRGDDGERPLRRRPDGPAPLESAGVDILQDGSTVDRIRPGETYDLVCRVRNEGDLDVPPSPIEFFVEHHPRSAGFDTVGNYVLARPETDQRITGWTTLPPGDALTVRIFQGPPDSDYFILGWERAIIQDDRTFRVEVDLSNANPDQEFRVTAAHIGRESSVDELVPAFETIGKVAGRFDAGGPAPRGPVPLAASLSEAEFVGVDHRRLTGKSESEGRVRYTTPDERETRALSVFYARTYAFSPTDLPNSLDRLTHVDLRHVGRTERHWQRWWR